MNILTGNNLFIVPHADDEALGFGGTISRLADSGRHIRVVTCFARRSMRGRIQLRCAKEAQDILKYNELIQLKLSSDCSDRVLVSALEKQIVAYSKEWIPAHVTNVWSIGGYENHQDHQRLFRCMCAALRPAHIKCVQSFLTGEVISSIDQAVGSVRAGFIPNVYITISADDLQKKIEAIHAYAGEVSRSRNETAVRTYATKRGGECGVIYAEAFMLHRLIE
jgi:LmbE family N-acetylglucosaminyl deacetylase